MNVNYVLLAEFDIDQGSTLKHQYPPSIHTADQQLSCRYVARLHRAELIPYRNNALAFSRNICYQTELTIDQTIGPSSI